MSFYVLKIYYTDGMNVGLQFIVNVLSKLQYISILKGLKSHYPESPSKTIMVFCIKVNVAVENGSKNR